jgi:ketosteroid isomerase-like protein
MKLAKWMKTVFAGVPSSAAISGTRREGAPRGRRKMVAGTAGVLACLLIAPVAMSGAAHGASGATVLSGARSAGGPTAESARAAEEELTRALLANDANAVGRMLADDWIVVTAYGGVGERSDFLGGIREGVFSRRTMELSEPRVRIYGNVALVTTKLKTAGQLGGKPFDVTERQTDVLLWHDGSWSSVLTHETKLRE